MSRFSRNSQESKRILLFPRYVLWAPLGCVTMQKLVDSRDDLKEAIHRGLASSEL